MIFIVTGEKDAGKSHFVKELSYFLHNQNFIVRGFLSVGVSPATGMKRFELLDLLTHDTWPLADLEPKEGHIQCGRYFFNPESIKRGELIIREALAEKPDLFIVDEAGRCETEGKVWASSIRSVMQSGHNLLLVIRKKNIGRMLAAFEVKDYRIINIDAQSVQLAIEIIAPYLEPGRNQ
jgi:nucleoside-triphosphatase THEP1